MEKNKITVDNYQISFSSSEKIVLEIDCNTKIDVKVLENAHGKLTIIGNNNYDININIEKEAGLIVESLNRDNSVNVNITLAEDSSISYDHAVLANTDSINTFNIKHLGNLSNSYITNSGINRNDNKLFFTINGVVPKDLKEVMCNQDSRIINFKNGNSKILPNLIIDTNDIMAMHSSYIGEIDEYDMFYMKSRGIGEEDIKKLIYKATLVGRLNIKEDDEKEELNKIINEWW